MRNAAGGTFPLAGSWRINTSVPSKRKSAGRRRSTGLFALEDQGDRLLVRPEHGGHHVAIRREAVAFDSDRAGLCGGYLQDIVIPPGFALEVFAGVNRGVVLGVGDVAVEEGFGGACIGEIA